MTGRMVGRYDADVENGKRLEGMVKEVAFGYAVAVIGLTVIRRTLSKSFALSLPDQFTAPIAAPTPLSRTGPSAALVTSVSASSSTQSRTQMNTSRDCVFTFQYTLAMSYFASRDKGKVEDGNVLYARSWFDAGGIW
ncbi:hypothetical protein BJV74DRAFT_799581 [Russula compacta]|nr:hypothetical protein BJV74DRAFT_799581 [Russula compacta]